MTADEIIRLLDELQRRLDGPGRYVFELAVRQVVLGALVAIVTALFLWAGFAALVLVGRFAVRRYYDPETASNEQDRWWLVGYSTVIIGIIVFALNLIATAIALASVPNLLNPEWAALTRIIETLKP
jgi:ABC-type multidrug transport system fused ATPase/permease subunit